MQLVKHDGHQEFVKPLPCNSWSCDWCGPRRRNQLMALAASGQPNKMLTITVNPGRGSSPTHRRNMLHDAWKKLVKRILRKFKWPDLQYMAFLERTKLGEPHLHILLRCPFIPQRWLSDQMRELIGAPIVWIEQIKGTAAAVKYVTKYVTKEPAQFGKGKRYWVSRKWEINKPPKQEREKKDNLEITFVRRNWADEMQRRITSGFSWDEAEDGWLRFFKPGERTKTFGRTFINERTWCVETS